MALRLRVVERLLRLLWEWGAELEREEGLAWTCSSESVSWFPCVGYE